MVPNPGPRDDRVGLDLRVCAFVRNRTFEPLFLLQCSICDGWRTCAFQHQPTGAIPGQRSGMQSLCLSQDEDHMATRDNTPDHNKAADEAARTARTVTDEAARVGEQTARAGADVFRRGSETA